MYTLNFNILIGLSEADAIEEAKLAGFSSFRVLKRDDESFMVTCDHRMDRINFAIKDGKVITATIG